MNRDRAPSVEEMLESSFGELRETGLLDPAYEASLTTALSLGVVLLPRLLPSRFLRWYCFITQDRAEEAMSEEALRESLRAFVGPGCSSFDGRPCRLERSDEVERDIGRLTGDRRVFAFEGDAARVGAALLLMIGVWSQVPRGRGVSFVRPLGRVRRSFEQALALGDARQAKACIEEMAGDGLLDAVNLNFLRVQYLSATQQWPALLELARDEALIDVRPPTPVLEDVARAVFLTSIGFDRAPNEALDLFNREVGDEFRGLFVAGDEIRHPDALALFALYWTSIGDRASVERLLGIPRYKGLPLHQLATSLLDLVSRSDEPTLSLGEAEGARDRGEFEQAFLIASQLPENDDRRAEILVHSAYELRRKSEARIALSSVDALPGGAPEFSSTRSRGNWLADLRRITQQPQGWLDWAAAAVREGGESVALRDALESNARSWGLQQTTAEEMSTLAAQLNEVEDLSLVLDAIPILYRAIEERGQQQGSSVICRQLLFLLCLDDTLEKEGRSLFLELLRRTLEPGISEEGYTEVASTAHRMWQAAASPSAFGWALETLEVLVDCPAPDNGAQRESFFRRLSGFADNNGRRLSAGRISVLRQLGEACGVNWAPGVPEEQASSAIGRLSGKTIAIYSLEESSAQRARDALQAIDPDMNVRLDASQDGRGGILENLARRSDVMVVVTVAATHAATGVIGQKRPKSLPTLYVNSKSAQAIIEALEA